VATRPWQHVLEPLSGYLQLGATLHKAEGTDALSPLCGGFNFGPSMASNRTVADLVQQVLQHWPGLWEDKSNPNAVHEATLLNLATDKAFHLLKWQPVWDFPRTIEQTVSWYRRYSADPAAATDLTSSQISDYTAEAKRCGIFWAQ